MKSPALMVAESADRPVNKQAAVEMGRARRKRSEHAKRIAWREYCDWWIGELKRIVK